MKYILLALTALLLSCCSATAHAGYVPAMGSLIPPFEYLDRKETKLVRKSVKVVKSLKTYVKPIPLEATIYSRPKVFKGAGKASYYWQGQRTANGEAFKPDGISCAHKTLPFNTRISVTNLSNGKSVVCRVNDRGPFIAGRVVDLSRGAARAVGMLGAGVVPVSISVL